MGVSSREAVELTTDCKGLWDKTSLAIMLEVREDTILILLII